MRQRAAEILAEARADRVGKDPRRFQTAPELISAASETKRFERGLSSHRVRTDQPEFPQVGYQHQTVARPMAADLIAYDRRLCILLRRLQLDDAALGNLTLVRAAALHLRCRIEAEIGMARPLIGEFGDTEHLRPERAADCTQQVCEWPVARPFTGRTARRTDLPQLGEVGFDRRRQLRIRPRHARSLFHAGQSAVVVAAQSATAQTVAEVRTVDRATLTAFPRIA